MGVRRRKNGEEKSEIGTFGCGGPPIWGKDNIGRKEKVLRPSPRKRGEREGTGRWLKATGRKLEGGGIVLC